MTNIIKCFNCNGIGHVTHVARFCASKCNVENFNQDSSNFSNYNRNFQCMPDQNEN